jgi:O-antigen/teichoic acid export membrane protein
MISDRSTRTKTIARNSLWTSVDTLVGIVPRLLVSVIVARKLGPENLGYFSYVMWFMIIAGRLGLYGTGWTIRKYVGEYLGRDDIAGAHAILRSNLRHQIFLAAGMFSAAIVAILAFVPRVHQPFALFAAASLVPQLLMVVYSQALTAAENFRANVLSTVVGTVVNAVSVVVLVNMGFGLAGVTFSMFAAKVADFLLKMLQFHRYFPKSDGSVKAGVDVGADRQLQQRMRRFYWISSSLLVLNLVVWDRSELVILKMYSSLRELAFYSLAFNICDQLLSFPQMIASSAGASLMIQYGRDSSKTGTLAATTMRYMCLLAFPALLGMAALSSPLLQVLYSWRYMDAVPVLMWLAILGLPRTMMLPAQQQIAAFERQSFLLKWGTAMAVLNIGLDVFLIRRFGALGAAWGNGLSQSLAACGIIYYAVRHLGVRVNFGSVGRILAASVTMSIPVALVARLLPPVLALLMAVPLGVLVYVAALRFTGALLTEDYDRLSLFLTKLPLRFRSTASRVLRTLIVQPSTPSV